MAKNKSRNRAAGANPALADGMRAIAFSGAWGTHQDARTRRTRTRATSRAAAIREYR